MDLLSPRWRDSKSAKVKELPRVMVHPWAGAEAGNEGRALTGSAN